MTVSIFLILFSKASTFLISKLRVFSLGSTSFLEIAYASNLIGEEDFVNSLAGTPATVTSGGTSLETTELAPILALSPTFIGPNI